MLFFSMLIFGKANADELLFGYGAHMSRPYVVHADKKLIGGWIYTTSDELSRELDAAISVLGVPRKRQAKMLEEGELDVYCFTNPAWMNGAKNVIWSSELFSVRNVIISNKSKARNIEAAEDLSGLAIGTILGYSYHSLNDLFNSGKAERFDNKNFKLNLQMLAAGRIDAAIVPSFIARELMAELNMGEDYAEAPFVVSNRPLHCAISKLSSFSPEKVLSAFSALDRKGVFNWVN